MNADDFRALTECWARVMEENRDRLIELDSVVGDSDLGLTMSDGFRAAANAVKRRCGNRMSARLPIRRGAQWRPPCPPPWAL